MTVPEGSDPEVARVDVLASIGHEIVAPLKLGAARQIYLTRHGGRRYVAKFWAPSAGPDPYPFRFHIRALNCLSPPASARLLVPTVMAYGASPLAGCFVVMTYFHGVGFEDRWHYRKPTLSGGVALTEGEIDLALDLMDDLRDMPAADAVAEGCKLVDAPCAAGFAKRRAIELVKDGLLRAGLSERVSDEVADWAASHDHRAPVISNTDFRFINFIEAPDERVALIDWDGGRASSFETEACCAYQWLFLWRRPELQSHLVAGARDRFDMDRETFRAALLMALVVQSYTCRKDPDLAAIHLAQLDLASTRAGFAAIWR